MFAKEDSSSIHLSKVILIDVEVDVEKSFRTRKIDEYVKDVNVPGLPAHYFAINVYDVIKIELVSNGYTIMPMNS